MELSKPPNAGIIGNSSSLRKPASRTATSIPLFHFQTEEAKDLCGLLQGEITLQPVSLRGWYFSEAESVIGKDNSQLLLTKSELITRRQNETLLTYEEVKPAIKMKKIISTFTSVSPAPDRTAV